MIAPRFHGLAVAAFALACAIAATFFVLHPAQVKAEGRSHVASTTGVQLTDGQWASLTIEPVRQASFDVLLSADGIIATDDSRSVPVYSPFSGRVISVAAQWGQTVRRGEPLMAMVALEAAQASSDLASANAAEANARQQLAQARAVEQRQHQLYLAEAGAEKDWLQSQTDLAAAENNERAAAVALQAAREKSALLGDGFQGVPGRVSVAAPIDGVVVQRQVVAGQIVNSLSGGASVPLFTISDLHRVWAVANVGEAEAQRLLVGDGVDVTPLALPGQVWRAQVTWIAAGVDPATHRVAVRAELPNPTLALKPQMTVTMRFLAPHPVQALAVPRSAIVYDGDQPHCYVVSGKHVLQLRLLHVGREQQGLVEVKSGLAFGDHVVTRGALFIDRAAEDAAS
jgi:cobalt-zinc-cadmium efflux system membrane fusion protein